jgi:hypothetical protein
MTDAERFGPMGGPAAYGTSMGRMEGWIDGPMAATDFDGKGIWAPAPAPDPQKEGPSPSPYMGAYGSSPILDSVEAIGDGGRWFG